MAKNLRTKGKIGPNIVHAWFDTVLNPLLHALMIEQECLEKKDWTWRFIPGGLEAIRPIHAHVHVGARDNLEQFLELHPSVNIFVRDHDKKVEILSDKCGQLQIRLEKSTELRRIYERAVSPGALSDIGATLQEIFGAYPPQDHIALLAQYIVNNTPELPPYHLTTARLWNKHQNEFLGVLHHRSIVLHAVGTAKAGETLLKSVAVLYRVLKDTRLRLSLEHDVPYAAASLLLTERTL